MNSREKRSLHLSFMKELYSELSEVILAWWSTYLLGGPCFDDLASLETCASIQDL
jgi:hypothetical protein